MQAIPAKEPSFAGRRILKGRVRALFAVVGGREKGCQLSQDSRQKLLRLHGLKTIESISLSFQTYIRVFKSTQANVRSVSTWWTD